MFCPKCGGKNDEDSRFCDQCGKDLLNGQTIPRDKDDSGPRAIIAFIGVGVFILIIIMFAIFGTRGGKGGVGGQSPGKPPAHDTTTGISDKELQNFIDEVIKPLYVCCNNSCYTRWYIPNYYCDYSYFTQYQGDNVKIEVETKPLSEADKLNGIEWAATLEAYGGKACRKRDDCSSTKQWGNWQERGTGAFDFIEDTRSTDQRLQMFAVEATKRNGKWEIKEPSNLVKGLTCADIPQ